MAVVSPLNPLSAPRNVKLVDEINGEPAKLVAVIDGVSYYYNTKESQELDFNGILHRISGHMAELNALTAGMGTSTDRGAQQKKARAIQAQIASTCEEVANANLQAKKFELAIPAGVRWLRMLTTIYGDGTPALIPAQLVLAEIHLGLSRIPQAESFLAAANFNLVKTAPDAVIAGTTSPSLLRSRLHRNFGRLYAAQGNNAAAMEAFSRDIFFCAMACGPEHISTSIGYFFLAQVFAAQARMEEALALFDKVVDVWYKTLLGVRSAISTALDVDFTTVSLEARLAAKRRAQAAAAAEAAAAAGPTGGAGMSSTSGGAAGGTTVKPLLLKQASTGGGKASLAATGGAGISSLAKATTGTGTSPDATGSSTGTFAPPQSSALTPSRITEGLEMLDFISRVRESQLGRTHLATGEVKYAVALLLIEAGGGRERDALLLLREAAGLFAAHLGEDHASTCEVKLLLAKLATEAPPSSAATTGALAVTSSPSTAATAAPGTGTGSGSGSGT